MKSFRPLKFNVCKYMKQYVTLNPVHGDKILTLIILQFLNHTNDNLICTTLIAQQRVSYYLLLKYFCGLQRL